MTRLRNQAARAESLFRGIGMAAAAILLLAVGLSCGRRSATPAYELRVSTWNLRWFPSGQPEPAEEAAERQTIDAAAGAVRRAEPSILCIQEVRDRAAAEALAQRSGLGGLRVVACTEFAAPEGAPGTQQVAILSNLPVRESGTERWRTKGTIDPPRGYAYALLDTPVGPVAVFSVHLKSNFIPKDLDVGEQTLLNRRKREVAADQLRGAAARLRTRAGAVSRVIVAGDFNTSLDDTRWAEETTLRRFATDGYVSCFDGTPTRRTRTLNASGTNPAATFDYILHRGFGSQRNLHVDPRRWVSDHRMVSVCLAP